MTEEKMIVGRAEQLYGIVGEDKASVMCRYRDGILERNQYINLTAVRDPEEFLVKHILDSLTCLDLPEFKAAKTVVDIGTGAGFPGVPLAIACPEKQFLLVDSLAKKLRVIGELTGELQIANVQTLHARAEEAGRNPAIRDQYDICVSRAVASLDVLAEWCLPLVRTGGYFLAYKGEKAEEELALAEASIQALCGEVCRMEEVRPLGEDADHHALIVIRKTRETPKRFPRKAGEARRNPIR